MYWEYGRIATKNDRALFTGKFIRNFEGLSCEINLHLLSDNGIYEAPQILELWGDNMITDIETKKARAEAVGK